MKHRELAQTDRLYKLIDKLDRKKQSERLETEIEQTDFIDRLNKIKSVVRKIDNEKEKQGCIGIERSLIYDWQS